MAVGAVSSASAFQNIAPTTPGIIRSGEKIATTSAALKSKSGKTYHHMAPGARFIMPDGLEVVFMGGQFTTADPEIIAELDRITDRPSSLVFTKEEVAQVINSAQRQVADDASDTAGKGTA